MKTIKLLDLCCGAGGAAMGYYLAAKKLGYKIKITGIDIEEQKNYPFKFIQADAIDFLKNNYSKFTHIHASPPCQAFSKSTAPQKAKGKEYADILPELKQIMQQINLPCIIENVPQAPIRPDIILRGDMFNLKVLRVRHFECVNWWHLNPVMPLKKGGVYSGDFVTVVGKGANYHNKQAKIKKAKFHKGSILATWRYAMGIDWMKTYKELALSIPPAYTQYIGESFFKHPINCVTNVLQKEKTQL